MAHCNLCGKYIHPQETICKRELYNGRFDRVYYGRKKVSFSTGFHHSMKTVCKECANIIDERNKKTNNRLLSVISIIVLGVLIYILLK